MRTKTPLRFYLLAALLWLSATPVLGQQYQELPPNSVIGNVNNGPSAPGNAVPLNELAASLMREGGLVQGPSSATAGHAVLFGATSTEIIDGGGLSGSGTVTSAQISGGAGINVTTTSGANPCTSSCNLTVGLSGARQTLPTIQTFTSGSGTYTTPGNVLWIEVFLVGGGSGGGGANNNTLSTVGGQTCWSTTNPACTTPLSAAGGAGGSQNLASGAGGTPSGTCNLISVAGGPGGTGGQSSATATIQGAGGVGGNSTLGGSGGGGLGAAANSGSGGSGGGQGNGVTATAGYGGSAGATCGFIINSPVSNYFFTVGSGGAGAGGGSGGNSGASGAAGKVWVIEHYGS